MKLQRLSVLLCCLASYCWGQTSGIQGLATDESNALVADGMMKLTNGNDLGDLLIGFVNQASIGNSWSNWAAGSPAVSSRCGPASLRRHFLCRRSAEHRHHQSG